MRAWKIFRSMENRLRAIARGVNSSSVDRGVKISVKHGSLALGKHSYIGKGTHIAVVGSAMARAEMTVGNHTRIGSRSRINVKTSLTIGDNCEISWLVQVLDSDFHTMTYLDGSRSNSARPITIGNHVLIGTGAIILKGVTIGDGAVIGAGAVVSRDVAANSIVSGNPAEFRRAIIRWV